MLVIATHMASPTSPCRLTRAPCSWGLSLRSRAEREGSALVLFPQDAGSEPVATHSSCQRPYMTTIMFLERNLSHLSGCNLPGRAPGAMACRQSPRSEATTSPIGCLA